MRIRFRHIASLGVAAAAAALIGAPVAVADPPPCNTMHNNPGCPTDNPGYWNGGDPAGGTGADAGPNTGTGPGYFNGGDPAGGTGTDTGPNSDAPGYFNGGNPAGAV